jgi:hypothetical protein
MLCDTHELHCTFSGQAGPWESNRSVNARKQSQCLHSGVDTSGGGGVGQGENSSAVVAWQTWAPGPLTPSVTHILMWCLSLALKVSVIYWQMAAWFWAYFPQCGYHLGGLPGFALVHHQEAMSPAFSDSLLLIKSINTSGRAFLYGIFAP